MVNSELIQRLGQYFSNIQVEMTTLDPHDFDQPSLNIPNPILDIPKLLLKSNPLGHVVYAQLVNRTGLDTIAYGDFLDPNVQRWANVSFADNYYQTAAPTFGLTATPNGRDIAKFDYTLALTGTLDGIQPARAGFIFDDKIGGTHSRPWRWYAGTVNLGLDFFESTAPNEQIVRTSLDVTQGGYLGGDTWYRPRGFALDRSDAPWEGIGTGWAFAPQGGGDRSSTWTVAERVPISQDNTEIPNAGQPAVPTIFNGNFEHGNLHRTSRYPLLVGHDMLATPGWSFLGGDFSSNDSGLVTEINGFTTNHVVELSSLSNTFIRHNWFYVPNNAQGLEFDLNIVQENLQQSGRLEITARIEDTDLGIPPIPVSSIALNGSTNGYLRLSTLLPDELRGKAITLEFRLVAPQPVFGADRVRLDNIALTLSQPLQTEKTQTVGVGSQAIDGNAFVHMLATAQAQWTGLVNVPVGSTGFGFTLGATASAAVNQGEAGAKTPAEPNGGAGFGQSNFDNQGLPGNTNLIHELAFGPEQIATFGIPSTDQFWADRDPAFAPDGHAIEAELDSGLAATQHEAVGQVRGEQAFKSNIGNEGSFVNNGSAIGISDINFGLQSTSPGGDGSISDLEVLDLQKLSLLPLQPGTNLFQVLEIQGVQVLPIVNVTARLGQTENQQNQRTFQHSISFGSQTVPTDRSLVNPFGAFSAGSSFVPNNSPLSVDQLSLLSKATITMADLADGNLVLTSHG